jgi:hypothetical protein
VRTAGAGQTQRGVVVELELLEGAELAPVESVVPEVAPDGAVEPASVGVFADPAVEPVAEPVVVLAPPEALVLSLGMLEEVGPAVVPLIDPLVVPLAAPVMPGLVDAPVLAAALVLAPVEAIDEPDHQSRLARCLGEAFRYSSSMA